MKKYWKMILLVILILAVVFYFGFSFYVASVMTSPLSKRLDTSPTVISEKYENIEFKASDGVALKGWFFEGSSNKVILMVTGLIANRINTEYLGSFIGKELIAKGYNLMLYDTRAHGESGGKRVGFGSVEGKDIVGAVNFLKSRGFEANKIGIIGDSTGAISTIMVADQLKDVGAIVADSPASIFEPIIFERLWKEKGVPKIFDPAIAFFTKTFFNVDLGVIRPIDKIKLESSRKYLFLHGSLDETIPPTNSEALLKAANSSSKRVLFPNGGHIETYKSDPALYRSEVYQFLNTELK